ncbi:MAG: GDSL-type esterase/lipase family protein [Candidatus Bathyarchaeota archaeon]
MELTIVAFGDSLTVGYRSHGKPIPYCKVLESMVSKMLSQAEMELHFRIFNRGINGDLTKNMLSRFQRDVVGLKPTYVIILGGSNDLGWNLSVKFIFSNLKKMFEEALKNSIEPIACSVPSILGFDELIPPRQELNQMIEHYCHQAHLFFVDLFAVTADPVTQRLREEYSDDGLHLTERGYLIVAEAIFHVLRKKLST